MIYGPMLSWNFYFWWKIQIHLRWIIFKSFPTIHMKYWFLSKITLDSIKLSEILLRPKKTDRFILLITRKRLKIFQFNEKCIRDPCPKNFSILNFSHVIFLEIGVNGWFSKVISMIKTIIAIPEPIVPNAREHVELSLIQES